MAADHRTETSTARSVLGVGGLVFASSMVLNLAGFVFHAIASRHLGVDQYGALYALLSLYTIAMTPVNVFTPVITKYAAEFGALHDETHLRGLIDLIVRVFAFFGAAYVVVALLFNAPLGGFLHVPRWQLIVVALMAAVAVLSATFRAIGQGVHEYAMFSYSVASEGIVKVAAVGLLALTGLTLFDATASFLIGIIAGVVLMAIPIVRRFARVPTAPIRLDWKRISATIFGSASLTLTVSLMGTVDVLIVKHFFSTNEAGLYSAVSLCARILLYFVGFIPVLLIPQATARHVKGVRTRQALWVALGFVLFISVFGVLLYRVLGAEILHALVGRAFDGGLPLLPTYAAAMACLAITNTLGSYGIATHRIKFLWPLLAATAITLGLIAAHHPTLGVVVDELLIGNILMLIGVAAPLALEGLPNV